MNLLSICLHHIIAHEAEIYAYNCPSALQLSYWPNRYCRRYHYHEPPLLLPVVARCVLIWELEEQRNRQPGFPIDLKMLPAISTSPLLIDPLAETSSVRTTPGSAASRSTLFASNVAINLLELQARTWQVLLVFCDQHHPIKAKFLFLCVHEDHTTHAVAMGQGELPLPSDL